MSVGTVSSLKPKTAWVVGQHECWNSVSVGDHVWFGKYPHRRKQEPATSSRSIKFSVHILFNWFNLCLSQIPKFWLNLCLFQFWLNLCLSQLLIEFGVHWFLKWETREEEIELWSWETEKYVWCAESAMARDGTIDILKIHWWLLFTRVLIKKKKKLLVFESRWGRFPFSTLNDRDFEKNLGLLGLPNTNWSPAFFAPSYK